jgi:4'-phosphopantetheinyl transferase
VHVWAAALDVRDDRQRCLAATLTPEERRRAARFRFPELRHRWTAGRGLLREILGHYLAVEPAAVRFGRNAHGKPMLAGEAQRPIAFNLARSGGLGLYALSSSRAVGVDLEQVREFPEMRAMAGNTFSPGERAALGAVSPEDYLPAFYRCWTRKEAYLKARGTGLLAPLDSFDVEVLPDRPAALLRVSGDATAPGEWTLLHLEPASGYVGALAVEAPPDQVTPRAWSWEPPD